MGMPENTGLPHQPFGISIIISLKRCIVEQEGGKHSNSHYGSIAVIPAWIAGIQIAWTLPRHAILGA